MNSKTKSGWTPLHFAAKNGHEGVVNYLVRKKAAVVDSMTMKKQTPLHLAATNGKLQVYSVITIQGRRSQSKTGCANYWVRKTSIFITRGSKSGCAVVHFAQ